MANATATLRALFDSNNVPLTMPDILNLAPQLRKNEVSMALCHLLKLGYLSREKVDRKSLRGRKEIWQYTFHAQRINRETEQIEQS
jgi:hypothetical protein